MTPPLACPDGGKSYSSQLWSNMTYFPAGRHFTLATDDNCTLSSAKLIQSDDVTVTEMSYCPMSSWARTTIDTVGCCSSTAYRISPDFHDNFGVSDTMTQAWFDVYYNKNTDISTTDRETRCHTLTQTSYSLQPAAFSCDCQLVSLKHWTLLSTCQPVVYVVP